MSTAERVLEQAAFYKCIFGYIQETSHTSASTAERVLEHVAFYKHTFGYILEKSHTKV